MHIIDRATESIQTDITMHTSYQVLGPMKFQNIEMGILFQNMKKLRLEIQCKVRGKPSSGGYKVSVTVSGVMMRSRREFDRHQ